MKFVFFLPVLAHVPKTGKKLKVFEGSFCLLVELFDDGFERVLIFFRPDFPLTFYNQEVVEIIDDKLMLRVGFERSLLRKTHRENPAEEAAIEPSCECPDPTYLFPLVKLSWTEDMTDSVRNSWVFFAMEKKETILGQPDPRIT